VTQIAPGSRLRASGATDVGRRRQVNEDRFHVDVGRGIFVVVDGMGGHAAGGRAADTALAAMIERLERQTGTIGDRLREAITIANNEVHRLAASRADWSGMACVATAAVVDGDRAVVGHVGDSRLYRLLDGRIEKMTPDHSPIGEREDAEEMSELEAMRHPRRNEVYRDVGSEPREPSDPGFAYVGEFDFPPGAGLLLCSDGLTDLVPSDAIRRIISAHAGAPERVVRALVAAANDAGGKDNITAVYAERPETALAAQPVHLVPAPAASGSQRRRWPLIFAAGALTGLAVGFVAASRGWGLPAVTGMAIPAAGSAVIVRPSESIMTAVAAALPGTSVIVEPGEYRERLSLRDGVRIISRVPHGATIRAPHTGSEASAAVVATGITNAEIDGFRIVGDAGSPLGVGVITRDASVRLVDLDITGAMTSALDLGAGDAVALLGSHIHDNPGAGLVVRTGATPRITNNLFARNATGDRFARPIVVEATAAGEWSHNVFTGMTVQDLAGVDASSRASLAAGNLFVAPPAGVQSPLHGRGRGAVAP